MCKLFALVFIFMYNNHIYEEGIGGTKHGSFKTFHRYYVC